jgi:hypothetical protein
MAAEDPRKTKKSVYVQPSIEKGQSQVDEKILAKKLISAGQATGAEIPIAFESGSQKTEKP